MADLINANRVKEVIADLYDDDIRFYGVYRGRGFFEGIGVTVESDSDLMRIASALTEAGMPELGRGFDHTDSMGFGRVIAWNKRRFEPVTDEQAREWEEELEDA